MAIEVTCPGCQKTFNVSDKFAGKKGPCPSCKTVITIPERGPEVVIHAPDTEGPKDAAGRPVLRPLRRKETKATPMLIGMIVGGIVLAIAGALVVRFVFTEPTIRTIVLALGAIGLGPPLVIGGYAFLRDQELEPYRGRAILVRAGICSAAYALIWAIYAYYPRLLGAGLEDMQLYVLIVVIPLMVAAGALAAYVSLDLEFGPAALHYGLYLAATVVLCLIAGVTLWQAEASPRPRNPRRPKAAAAIVAPREAAASERIRVGV